MKKSNWTKSGFVTVTGLKAGEVQTATVDEENYVMLSMGESHPHAHDLTIDVDVVKDGVTTNWNFLVDSINLARKRFSREAKGLLRPKPTLASIGSSRERETP